MTRPSTASSTTPPSSARPSPRTRERSPAFSPPRRPCPCAWTRSASLPSRPSASRAMPRWLSACASLRAARSPSPLALPPLALARAPSAPARRRAPPLPRRRPLATTPPPTCSSRATPTCPSAPRSAPWTMLRRRMALPLPPAPPRSRRRTRRRRRARRTSERRKDLLPPPFLSACLPAGCGTGAQSVCLGPRSRRAAGSAIAEPNCLLPPPPPTSSLCQLPDACVAVPTT
mmetsp:Transcript_16843/g.63885  ORF Transcript_16843/g.63885 Transcript_16843/m.63885 type:complete len:231 (+) Transcript_16843:1138-1830(+)